MSVSCSAAAHPQWRQCHHPRRDRAHAHDPQRPTEGPCQIASSAAILFVGRL